MVKILVLSLVLFASIHCQPAPSNQTSDRDSASTADTSHQASIDTFAVDIDYLMGKFDPETHPDFAEIDTAFADRPGLFLRKETYDAFQKMHAAAANNGIVLVIRSAARNFYRQKAIWEAKWTGDRILDSGEKADVAFPEPKRRALKILEYSSMPGTSRHHWGTDIDLNAFNNAWFEKGEGKRMYEWLRQHADKYGFCQVYTEIDEDRPTGYQEEKWHWSYLPMARKLTVQCREQLKNEMISGFKGADTAGEIDVVKNYVLGIDPACK